MGKWWSTRWVRPFLFLPLAAHPLPLPVSTRLLLPCPQAHARGCDPSGSLFGGLLSLALSTPCPYGEIWNVLLSLAWRNKGGLKRQRCGKCPHFSKPQMCAQDCSHVCEGVWVREKREWGADGSGGQVCQPGLKNESATEKWHLSWMEGALQSFVNLCKSYFFSFFLPSFFPLSLLPFFLSCQILVAGFSCGIRDLVPWPGIKPRLPALGAWRLSHWITREAL